MQQITISVRDFALPAPLTGSIEAHSGYARAAAEGQEIHLRIQKKRAKDDPLYRAEVAIGGTFERAGYRFRIEGRIDGLFLHAPARIEEIKSSFAVTHLSRSLSGDPFLHPYSLQLLTYGYLYLQENGELPALSFHLVSSRTGESIDVTIPFSPARYEEWLERRLDELLAEARHAEKRTSRRRKMASRFPFPFATPRPGQIELMNGVTEAMADAVPVLIQAATGLGKTVGILFPLLKEALGRGQKVVYVTPKNSQHAVAEDAAQRFRECGAPLRSLAITAKGKICPKNEPLCTPEYCEYARDHYTKVSNHRLPELLARKRKLDRRLFEKLGAMYQVCPFELQFDASDEADLVICDYNYVFAPRSAMGRLATVGPWQEGKPNLVIDEAHNLPTRGMDYYSPALATADLVAMEKDVANIAPSFQKEVSGRLKDCIDTIASLGSGDRRPHRIDPPLDRCREQEARLSQLLARYLEADVEIGQGDPVLRLCFSWSAFTEMLGVAADPDRSEFFTTFHPHPAGGTIRITCCDASAMLKECYADYRHIAGFSATLKPFAYYAELAGIDGGTVRTLEYLSPFPRNRRKILIIPQVSTRYADRERNYRKVAEGIHRIASLRPGNYLAFFPSFGFLERVSDLFTVPDGFRLVHQERGMPASRVETLLEELRSGTAPAIVFGVQGGSLAEGIDYYGDLAIGVFVVGPPLPTYDLERELRREYYQSRYGDGFAYAYTIPAMAKAVQAAGRVIRSEADRGLIVLMDGRFTAPDYSRAMPGDWFTSSATELVSGSILSDVEAFWETEATLD